MGVAAGTLAAGSAFGQAAQLVTPRQTLGPFFPDEGDPVHEIRENLDFRLPISEANDNNLTSIIGNEGRAMGQTVYVKGRVLFQDGKELVPQPGAVIILWNASSTGRYNHRGDTDTPRFQHPKTGEWIDREHDANFQYWGRSITDKRGRYLFKTVVPGFYPVDLKDGWFRPPHLHFMVSAPGIPQLVTQLYFKGDKIPDNDFIQILNSKDYILRDSRMTREEQDSLVVDFQPDPSGQITDSLIGQYDFVLKF